MQSVADQFGLPSGKIKERTGVTITEFMAQQLAANILVAATDLNVAAGPGRLLFLVTNLKT